MTKRKPKPDTRIPYCHPGRPHVRNGLCAACADRGVIPQPEPETGQDGPTRAASGETD